MISFKNDADHIQKFKTGDGKHACTQEIEAKEVVLKIDREPQDVERSERNLNVTIVDSPGNGIANSNEDEEDYK